MVKVKCTDLKTGMYIVIPASWDSHPFFKNSFLIKSSSQINKLIDYKIESVFVDPQRSVVTVPDLAENQKQHAEECLTKAPPVNEVPVVPNALRETIRDKRLPLPERARLVREHTFVMMENLLENPTAGNIKESKNAIAEIVDFVMENDDATNYLIKITDHDYYTYTHSVNVGFWAISLAKVLFRGSDAHNMHELGAGFFLHDIGKVLISNDIINKSGPLSDEEMHEMRKHPSLGFRILNDARQLTEECKTIVLQHHEKIDGTGYPKGLRGDEIHVYGKICAIADVFDALTSNRSYRKGNKPFDALKIMRDLMPGHFEKNLFETFVRMLA